jgi:hypothetical protein
MTKRVLAAASTGSAASFAVRASVMSRCPMNGVSPMSR